MFKSDIVYNVNEIEDCKNHIIIIEKQINDEKINLKSYKRQFNESFEDFNKDVKKIDEYLTLKPIEQNNDKLINSSHKIDINNIILNNKIINTTFNKLEKQIDNNNK